jgi:hypothetical protein
VLTLRDLFQTVYELKKKEIEDAKSKATAGTEGGDGENPDTTLQVIVCSHLSHFWTLFFFYLQSFCLFGWFVCVCLFLCVLLLLFFLLILFSFIFILFYSLLFYFILVLFCILFPFQLQTAPAEGQTANGQESIYQVG